MRSRESRNNHARLRIQRLSTALDQKEHAIFNLVSLAIGLVAFVVQIVIFLVPLLGGLGSWPVLVAAIVGAGIGQLATSKSGRNFNIFVILIALLRLSIGGGIL